VSRSKWTEELEQRQRNVLPKDTIPNSAVVEGYIIRGDKRLSGVQRTGALVLGLCYSLPGVGGLVAAVLLAFDKDSSLPRWLVLLLTPVLLLVSAGWLYISTKMILNSLRGGGRKRPHTPH